MTRTSVPDPELSTIRRRIENIKTQVTPLMRLALEDLLTAGDCYILLPNMYRSDAYVLSAVTIRYASDSGYEQVFHDGTRMKVPAEELLHLRIVKSKEPQ